MEYKIALVGNPNSGKTTFFNLLSGSSQRVGNWPGVTVEKKEGFFHYENIKYNVIDLPGIYSLGAYSEDEVVSRDYILSNDADVYINVVDASNIERNLYLTTQLLEMKKKVIIALNMVDEANKREINVDIDNLSKMLNVDIVETIANKGVGKEDLISKTIKLINEDKTVDNPIVYSKAVVDHTRYIKDILSSSNLDIDLDFVALKIVEHDTEIMNYMKNAGVDKSILDKIDDFYKYHSKENFELDIVDSRYQFSNNVLKSTIKRPSSEVVLFSDKLDKIITNKYLGIPIFALLMFIVFQITFVIGQDLLGEFVVSIIENITIFSENLLININAPTWLTSFIVDGFFSGVGAVVEFVPLIAVLYLLLGLLEDSGYMARAAYVWDDLMRKFGLQGKAFISMIIGFGCTVPSIMSTRTMDSKKDRMVTMLITPFISCGAKIPIYSVFIAAFFKDYGGLVLFALYAFGILTALIMAKIFNATLFKGESSYFIMELPPYRIPTVKNVLSDMYNNVSGFLLKAGTTIFLVVTIMWLLAVLPNSSEAYSQYSYLGRIGSSLTPIFSLAGFGTWQESVALFAGIPAKEAVVGTLGMLYAGEYLEEGVILVDAIRNNFTPLTSISYMIMVLLYTPCAATLSIIKKETKSYKWPIFVAVYTFIVGFSVALIVYQVGSLLGFS